MKVWDDQILCQLVHTVISGLARPLSVQLHDDSFAAVAATAHVDMSSCGGQFSLALHDHVHLLVRRDQILELKRMLNYIYIIYSSTDGV